MLRHRTRYAERGIKNVTGFGAHLIHLATDYGMKGLQVLFKKAEPVLIGDLKSFGDEKLTAIALQNESKTVVKSLGLIGKVIGSHFAVVVFSTRSELRNYLQFCDNQKSGRKHLEGYNVVLGNADFVFSSTKPKARQIHDKIRNSLNIPSRDTFLKIAEEETLAIFKDDLTEEKILHIVRNILARVILGTRTPLSIEFHNMLNQNSVQNTVDIIPPRLRLFSNHLSERRKKMKEVLNTFFETQAPFIQQELRENLHGPYKSLLTIFLVEAVQEHLKKYSQEEITELLRTISQEEIVAFLNTDGVLKSLPLTLLGGDVLMKVILNTLKHFEFGDRDAEIVAESKSSDPFAEKTCHEKLIMHYKESLRFALKDLNLVRYTNCGIPGLSIPPDTFVEFRFSPLMDDPKFGFFLDKYDPLRFDPESFPTEYAEENPTAKLKIPTDILTFSAGTRMCPGYKIAEFIYEGIITTILRTRDAEAPVYRRAKAA